jgi:integrase
MEPEPGRRRTQMARIRKRGAKYHVSYKDPVTKGERSAGTFIRKIDAQKQKRAVEYQLHAGEWIDPKLQATPYGEWAQQWFNAQSHLRIGTRENNASALNARVLPVFGEAALRDIRPIHVEQFVADLSAELSPSRVRQVYNVLNASLKAAVKSEMLKANPAESVKLPRQTTRKMLFLDPQQVEALAAEIGDEHSTLVYLLAYGGLRIGEARALRRSRVNLMRGTLEIKESVTYRGGDFVFTPPKNGKERVATIPRFLRSMLEQHLDAYAGKEPDALVFPGTDGGPLTLPPFRRNEWKPALLRAGIDESFRIHDMRHTTASLLINQGLHPKIVQEHLGHHSISITLDRYGHLYETDTQRLADALDAAFATGLVAPGSPETVPTADNTRTNGWTAGQDDPAGSAEMRAAQGL